ncbi:MAG TPA: DUF1345 domain-containing protein [Methylovirgula sp.]|jgi:uncharacterized membrane protein|nr:DUF1345 domain-containing protein [Methylovirgula sp.]
MSEPLSTPVKLSMWGAPRRVMKARPRLFTSLLIGIIIGFVTPADWRITTRILLGWNSFALIYFVLAGHMFITESHAKISRRADEQDEGRFVILIFAILAAVAAFGAIILELALVKDMKGLMKNLHILLAAGTIVSAWALIHLMFTLHYAHEFVIERAARGRKPAKSCGGLIFPGTDTPDYMDFLYFSYVIGVACQTADVEISSPEMRTIALVHGVLAFFFNSAVLALTINIAAGLI